jgi:hypothetical protein
VWCTTSGIVPDASATCRNASGAIPYAVRLDYTSYQDFSSCLYQNSGNSRPCDFGTDVFGVINGTDLFSPIATAQLGFPSGTCPSPGHSTSSNTQAYLSLAAGVYTLAIQNSECLMFLGTATIASPPCRIITPITFTNTVVPGNIYTGIPLWGNAASVGYGWASGGSATVVFKKSCCH